MKIAVIGGIGSGKSYVLNLIAGFGERVCDCDAIYKEISVTDDYVKSIAKVFDVVKDGVIDRKKLAGIVFSDREKLKLLNSVAHPLVFKKLDKIYAECKGNLYVEVSAFNKAMSDKFDKIILVYGDKEVRIERVIDRSGYDREYIENVMREQAAIEEMKNFADYIIVNDSDKENLREKVKAVLDDINKTDK